MDGYLFQAREEHIQAGTSTKGRLAYLGSLVRIAIEGLQETSAAGDSDNRAAMQGARNKSVISN